jgi:hypothetical protein
MSGERHPRPQRGSTVLELLITIVIMLVVFAVVYGALVLGQRYLSSEAIGLDLDAQARAALDGMLRELRSSGPARLAAPAPGARSGFTTFQYRRTLLDPDGLDEADWGPLITYRLDPSPGEDPMNGIDDDADGLVDERSLVRVESGEVTNVIDGVLLLVYERHETEPRLEVTVSIATKDSTDASRPYRLTTRTTIVTLRNPEI